MYDYLIIISLLSPLFLFIIAVSFRLLDNSALLFLQKEIMVDSANVSRKTIEDQIKNNNDREFTRRLKRALCFKKLHRIFLGITLLSLPIALALYFVLF